MLVKPIWIAISFKAQQLYSLSIEIADPVHAGSFSYLRVKNRLSYFCIYLFLLTFKLEKCKKVYFETQVNVLVKGYEFMPPSCFVGGGVTPIQRTAIGPRGTAFASLAFSLRSEDSCKASRQAI